MRQQTDSNPAGAGAGTGTGTRTDDTEDRLTAFLDDIIPKKAAPIFITQQTPGNIDQTWRYWFAVSTHSPTRQHYTSYQALQTQLALSLQSQKNRSGIMEQLTKLRCKFVDYYTSNERAKTALKAAIASDPSKLANSKFGPECTKQDTAGQAVIVAKWYAMARICGYINKLQSADTSTANDKKNRERLQLAADAIALFIHMPSDSIATADELRTNAGIRHLAQEYKLDKSDKNHLERLIRAGKIPSRNPLNHQAMPHFSVTTRDKREPVRLYDDDLDLLRAAGVDGTKLVRFFTTLEETKTDEPPEAIELIARGGRQP